MFFSLMTRSRVPADLTSVTTAGADREVDPRSVGVNRAAVVKVWNAVERLYQTGIHPAIALCVRRRGEVLLDRAIGYASGNGPDDRPEARKVLARPDTPFTIFSTSKSITGMLIHLLDERNLIRLDDPVCEYIPEFRAHGKHLITIRHVLTHRAGIPDLPPEAMDLNNLDDPERIVRVLCAARPSSRPGSRLAYHAISGGFVLGEVVRRVTGADIRRLLQEAVVEPMGWRCFSYGAAARDLRRVAVNYFTGPPALPPISGLLRRALGVEFRTCTELSNDARFLTGVVPAGNVVTTADELCQFYQLLLNGGELHGVRVFQPRTVRRATLEQSYLELDLTLGVPVRYGMGFMLGAGGLLSPYGPDTEHAFGHLGFTNVLAWADPERQVAAALLTSGKPLLYPQLYHLWNVLREIGLACPKGPYEWPPRVRLVPVHVRAATPRIVPRRPRRPRAATRA